MGFLITALIILSVILIILALKISVRVTNGDNFTLKLGVGIFRITLTPRKEKKVRLSDYKIKKYRKRLQSQEEKERKKLLKKPKKKSGKKIKVTENVRKKAESAPKKRDIMELIGKLKEVVLVFISRFRHHLHIKIKRLHITVATDNAADTAVLYGAVCGGVTCLLDIMYSGTNLDYTKDAVVAVEPDFTATKTKALVDITFSFRIWQLFDIAVRSAWKYINI